MDSNDIREGSATGSQSEKIRVTLLRWGVALKKAGSPLWHYYLVLEGAFIKAMRWVGKKIAPLFAFTQKINLPFLSSAKAFFRKLFAPLAPYKRGIYRSLAWCGIVLVVVLIGVSLGNNRNKITPEKSHVNTTSIDYAASFKLDYGKTFNDENPVHIEAAQRFGIVPIADSASRAKALDAMVEIFTCDRYKVDSLEHSIPYLVPEAKDLLDDLGADFAPLPMQTKRQLNYNGGLLVQNVRKNGAFAKAGIENGFIVLKINNKPVSSTADIKDAYNTVINSNDTDKVLFVTVINRAGVIKHYIVTIK